MTRQNHSTVISLAIATLLLAASSLSFATDTIEVIIKDHKFNPSEITIPANTKVKLKIINQDPTPEEFESHSLHREKVIPGNSDRTVNIGPLKPGKYEFEGEFNSKTAKGHIIVK